MGAAKLIDRHGAAEGKMLATNPMPYDRTIGVSEQR